MCAAVNSTRSYQEQNHGLRNLSPNCHGSNSEHFGDDFFHGRYVKGPRQRGYPIRSSQDLALLKMDFTGTTEDALKDPT